MTEHDRLLVYVALACMWIAGYATGRGRVIKAIVAWADWQLAYATPRSPGFWVAVPVVLTAAACLWIARPRRTWTNYQAWKARQQLAPGPQPGASTAAHQDHDTNGST
ncbi:hypothetical protein ACFXJ6_21090 [Streptomyces sp. NPDC059218]|uniref:hypothetical protein n=1 Tax=unclassified Streptomyces TaxID=2593676 RepID=UPI0036A56648